MKTTTKSLWNNEILAKLKAKKRKHTYKVNNKISRVTYYSVGRYFLTFY